MSASEKISQFEKASKTKNLTLEEQRKRAKFEVRRSKFQNESQRSVSSGAIQASEVIKKARDFMDNEGLAQRQQEAMQRKESFDKARKEFVQGSSINQETEDQNEDKTRKPSKVQASLVMFEPEKIDEESEDEIRNKQIAEQEEREKRREDFKRKAQLFNSMSQDKSN